MLVHSFICNRIDYCNSVLYSATRLQLNRFQSILNAAARIFLKIPKFSHILASIRSELHWLPSSLPARVQDLPLRSKLSDRHRPALPPKLCFAVSSSAGRRNLRSASRWVLVVPRADTTRLGRAVSLFLGRPFGTAYRRKFDKL